MFDSKVIIIARAKGRKTIFALRAGASWPEKIVGTDKLVRRVGALREQGFVLSPASEALLSECSAGMTPAQRTRQEHRDGNGRYAQEELCEVCNQSAGVEYWSDDRCDTVDSEGNDWSGIGLCLCRSCHQHMQELGDGDAFAVITGAAPAVWLTKEKTP